MENTLTDTEVEKPEVGEQQKDTAEDSSTTEETTTEITPPQEGVPTDNTLDEEKLPFHKHPRWKAMYEDNKQKDKVINELLEFKNKFEPIAQAIQTPQQATPIPEWFKAVYGELPEVWEKYQTYTKEERTALKAELVNEIKQEQQATTQESTKWNDWVADQLKGMEEEGLKFNRNELQKFMVDWQDKYGALPLDKEGNLDFRKSLNLMQEVKPVVNNDKDKLEAKKQIVAKTASTTGGESKGKTVFEVGKIPTSWRDTQPLNN